MGYKQAPPPQNSQQFHENTYYNPPPQNHNINPSQAPINKNINMYEGNNTQNNSTHPAFGGRSRMYTNFNV